MGYFRCLYSRGSVSKSIYDDMLSSTVLSEDQFIHFLKDGYGKKAIDDGDQSKWYRKLIHLENSTYPSSSHGISANLHRIIGFNHDNSSYTVDIIGTKLGRHFCENGTIEDGYYNRWSTSTTRTWLNNTYLWAYSSKLRSNIMNMNVTTYESYESGSRWNTTSDYIKILSAEELGLYGSSFMYTGEGSTYPVFNRAYYSAVEKTRLINEDMNTGGMMYYTRSATANSDKSTLCGIDNVGKAIRLYAQNNGYCVMPVMRFKIR